MTTNGKEPLVELWAERNRALALVTAADIKVDFYPLARKLSAIEARIIKAKAKTLAGVVVQIKLYHEVVGPDAWTHGAKISRNIITALERMEGAS